MKTIAIINGANLNMLGTREPQLYGTQSLSDINQHLVKEYSTKAELTFFQSNHEGHLIDHIHGLKNTHGIVINPGSFTHTSIAIRDAILSKLLPAVEVHLSNIHRREEFRKVSFISDICIGTLAGFGALGYELALNGLLWHLNTKEIA